MRLALFLYKLLHIIKLYCDPDIDKLPFFPWPFKQYFLFSYRKQYLLSITTEFRQYLCALKWEQWLHISNKLIHLTAKVTLSHALRFFIFLFVILVVLE